MFRVVEPSAALAALPPLEPADAADISDADLVVVALGYEERATSGLMTLVERGLAAGRVAVCLYATHNVENDENREAIEELVAALSASPISYLADTSGLAEDIKGLIDELPITRQVHVVVDLSAMSGRMLLACINGLTLSYRRKDMKVTFLYAEAEEYFPNRADFEAALKTDPPTSSLGLDEGVVTVESAFVMRGSHAQELKDLLIVIPGFSRDRVRAAISLVNPALVLDPEGSVRWTVGTPRLAKDTWREQAMMRIHEMELDRSDFPHLSTFEYRSVYAYLESTYQEEWIRSNLSIIFLGSKLQGLAVGLFCAVRGGVRVIVSIPERYRARDYTKGTREVWVVGFNGWNEHLDSLSSIGTVQLVD